VELVWQVHVHLVSDLGVQPVQVEVVGQVGQAVLEGRQVAVGDVAVAVRLKAAVRQSRGAILEQHGPDLIIIILA